MEYKINIAQLVKPKGSCFTGHYAHLCKVEVSYYTVREVYTKLQKAFPSPEYEISITQYETTGTPKTLKDFP